MATTSFEDITREEFQAYEEVRASGVINMWDSKKGCELSGLGGATYLGIIAHYSALADKWPDVRKEVSQTYIAGIADLLSARGPTKWERELAAYDELKAKAARFPELVEALEALAHYFEPLEVGVPLFNNLPRLRETVIKARAALAKAEALLPKKEVKG